MAAILGRGREIVQWGGRKGKWAGQGGRGRKEGSGQGMRRKGVNEEIRRRKQ